MNSVSFGPRSIKIVLASQDETFEVVRGCVHPIFWVEKGEVPLVESGPNALIAAECCIENNHRADPSIGRLVALPPDQKMGCNLRFAASALDFWLFAE